MEGVNVNRWHLVQDNLLLAERPRISRRFRFYRTAPNASIGRKRRTLDVLRANRRVRLIGSVHVPAYLRLVYQGFLPLLGRVRLVTFRH